VAAVVRGPVTERRAQHRATTAQHGVQRQHADRNQNTPPVAAAAVAAAAVRPFHHDFRPSLGGTGQGTAGSGSVAPDAGARFARRPHTAGGFAVRVVTGIGDEDVNIIIIIVVKSTAAVAGQRPNYCRGVTRSPTCPPRIAAQWFSRRKSAENDFSNRNQKILPADRRRTI